MKKPVKISLSTDSYAVVTGNTFLIKNRLQEYGFTLNYQEKYWSRPVLTDKMWYWEQTIESLSKDILVFWVKNLSDIPMAKKEVMAIKRESFPVTEFPPHKYDGAIFEVKKWYSLILQEKLNTAFSFRNLKIIKITGESFKAYKVDAEFFGGIASSCGVCGLSLTNDISRATGIGPICAGKLGIPRPSMENVAEIIKSMEAVVKSQGKFQDIWIPKSQIKKILIDGKIEELSHEGEQSYESTTGLAV